MGEHETYAVEAKGLVKKFGDFTAVNEIDLKIKKGSVYAFLGPNGAGKTTTVRMLATLLKIDKGSARVFGYDVQTEAKKIRPRISLTGQFASVDEDLTGAENLVMVSRLMGFTRKEAKNRATELLKAFGLEKSAHKQTKEYSGGMRRRLDIAASIVVTPDILLLDEPTTGLDPRSRNQVWDVIRALIQVGTTVLLTTQYLDEADQLADRIAVIDKGVIVAEGTANELKASIGSKFLHITLTNEEDYQRTETILKEKTQSDLHESSNNTEFFISVDNDYLASEILNLLKSEKISLATFSLNQPSLDEVFLTLTD